MQKQAISDTEFQKRYRWQPPKIVDRSDTLPGQQMLPGMGEVDKAVPGRGITKDHPLYGQSHNRKVWGSLVGHHNPFLHHGLTGSDDVQDGWDHLDGWDDKNQKLEHRVTKHLQKTISAGHPCVAVNDHILHKVLDEGRLKSQFETQTSNGSLNIPGRATAERDNFGYSHPEATEDSDEYDGYDDDAEDENERHDRMQKHPDHARPIYGFLAHDPVMNDTARQYGHHTLVLKKPKVWHRTTATVGDSLGRQNEMRASPVHDFQMHSARHDDGGSDCGYGCPTPEDYESDGIDYEEATSKVLHHKLSHHLNHSLDDRGEYTEAQYHGGLSTNDIHYAILRQPWGHDNDIAATKAHLDKVGVPWVHVNDGVPGYAKDHSHHEALFHRVLDYQASLVATLEGRGMAPKVVAERGGGVYLLDLGNDQGQIADTKAGVLYPARNLSAIISRGYWEPVHDVDAADVLHVVKPI